MTPTPARLLVLGSLALLAACAGGDGYEGDAPTPPPPPPPAGNQPPVATFSAPATVQAGTSAALDARSSSDPEGGALTFSWSFGDGGHGGTAQIAHIYSAAGTYSARLTVTDAQGLQSTRTQAITVSVAAPAARQVQADVLVQGTDGQPLPGVTVSVEGHSGSATTGADGRATLELGVNVEVVLRLSRAGYTDQVKALRLPATVGNDAYVEATLMPRAAPQTLADAAAGGTLTGASGVQITLPAGALVDANGAAVTGAVLLSMTPVDVNTSAVAAFPGRFTGVQSDGSTTPIVSYGSTEFVLTQGGQPLQLKAGARASIDLPLYASRNLDDTPLAAGSTLPLWSLDERSGQWVNEGSGSVVAAAASPTGLVLRAEVGHFSWWNADKGYTPYRPRPRCINDVPGQYDDIFAQAMICKMLAEMDKPIPTQSSAAPGGAAGRKGAQARPAADAPRFPFPAVRIEEALPIGGGVPIDIPPDYDVLLTGTALNGTWRGQARVRGAQGAGLDVNVPLRPVTAGSPLELITLPFDQVRAAAVARLDRYRFSATAGQGVEVLVSQAQSTLTGTARLRDAAGSVLASDAFTGSAATLRFQLPAAGDYTIEVEPASGAPGAYRLQASHKVVPAVVPSTGFAHVGSPVAPKVAGNASGQAVAAWAELHPSTGWGVMASRLSAGAWSAPQVVASAPGYSEAVGLEAGIDAAGNAVLAWDQGSGPVVARQAPTAAWSAPLALGSAACPGGRGQRLAVAGDGNAALLWIRGAAAASSGLCTRSFQGSSASWQAEREIAAPVSSDAYAITLAIRDGGDALAAWGHDSVAGVSSARFSASTNTWGNTLALAADWGHSPTVALAGDGGALVAWVGLNGNMAAPWPVAEAGWGDARRVGDGRTPIALWRGGARFSVVWQSFNSGIFGVNFDLAIGQWGQWGSDMVVANENIPLLVHAAAATNGRALVAWIANKPNLEAGVNLGFSRLDALTGTWSVGPPLLSVAPLLAPPLGLGSASVSVAGERASAVWLQWRADRTLGVVASDFDPGP